MADVRIGHLALRYVGRDAARRRAQLDDLAVRSLAPALEDALAPLDDGRLVLVRRLETRLAVGWRDDVAERMRAWAGEVAAAVRAGIERASLDDDTPVIVFADATAALRQYVLDALVRRERWCWRPQAPALTAMAAALAKLPSLSPIDAGPSAPSPLETAAAVRWAYVAAGASLPQLVRALGDAAAEATVFLEEPLARRLLQGLDGVAPAATPPPPLTATAAADAFATAAARVVRWPAPAPNAARNLLLLALLATCDQPTLRGGGRATQAAQATLRRLATPAPAPSAPVAAAPVAGPVAAVDAADALSAIAPIGRPVAAPSATPPADVDDDDDALPDVTDATGMPWGQASATRWGGLWFLLRFVDAVDLAAALDDEPALADASGIRALVSQALTLLAADAAGDPSLATLAPAGAAAPAPLDAEHVIAAHRLIARLRSRAAALGALAGDDDSAFVSAEAARLSPPGSPHWIVELATQLALAIAGLLRRALDSELPLPALVRKVAARPGRILASRTHLDVRLALDELDLDVRRAALDVDLGWVSWLERVVSFHYV